MHVIRRTLVLLALVTTPGVAPAASSFDPRIVTFGPTREQLKNTPITQRPNRPLHVYGNSVRRRHRRSTPVQRPASRPTGQPAQSR